MVWHAENRLQRIQGLVLCKLYVCPATVIQEDDPAPCFSPAKNCFAKEIRHRPQAMQQIRTDSDTIATMAASIAARGAARASVSKAWIDQIEST